MKKTFTLKQLLGLIDKYPGDKAEAAQFVEWCKNHDPSEALFQDKRGTIQEAARQWFELCLMQIEDKNRDTELIEEKD